MINNFSRERHRIWVSVCRVPHQCVVCHTSVSCATPVCRVPHQCVVCRCREPVAVVWTLVPRLALSDPVAALPDSEAGAIVGPVGEKAAQ